MASYTYKNWHKLFSYNYILSKNSDKQKIHKILDTNILTTYIFPNTSQNDEHYLILDYILMQNMQIVYELIQLDCLNILLFGLCYLYIFVICIYQA